MAFEQLENTPLAVRARATILEAILSKQFETRLPAEDELAQLLNVSRTTIRAALQDLQQEGIITRRRAVGTRINRHVRPSTLALQRLVGFDWLLRERGHEVEVEVQGERSAVPETYAELFPTLTAGEDCFMTTKSYLADGVLALCLHDVVPWRHIAVDDIPDKIPPSLFEFSSAYCREPINHAVVQIVARVKRGSDTLLNLEEGEPFTRLLETHYTVGADPLAVSLIDVNDSFIRLEVFRREHAEPSPPG